MATLRDDIADLVQRLDQSAEALPHRAKYLGLVRDFLRRLVDDVGASSALRRPR